MKSTITVETLPVGQMAANCYLLRNSATSDVLVIDPGEDASYIADHVIKDSSKPAMMWATHGHFDHILAGGELALLLDVGFFIHESDRFLVARMGEAAAHFLKRTVPEPPPAIGGTLTAGEHKIGEGFTIRVIETPGHTPGSVSFYLKKERILFTGDTLFAGGSVGRTDFSYSDKEELGQSIATLLSLPDDTIIYPGHGEPTTVKNEKEYHTI